MSSKRAALTLMLGFTSIFLALGFCSRARDNPHLVWTFLGVAVFLGCWQWALFQRPASKSPGLKWEFVAVRSHYVQALVQLSIYAYWGIYWPKVFDEAPLILAQVAFLYAFEGLVCWSRGLTWRIGFGPWPIIFSTNLFLWFRDDWFFFQFLMVAVGVLGKHFIRWRRDGKLTHIFNPSAFALTVVSLVLLLTGTTDQTWGVAIATTQDWPPHLYTVIFLSSLVVQYFFSVTLLTFSAVVALILINFIFFHATGVYFFFAPNISTPVFLALHLLMTDPATTPRSSMGKIAFGGLFGFGVGATYWGLEALDLPNIYQKLLVVPFLNLLTPLLDRFAGLSLLGKFGRWETSTDPRKMNLGYIGCWGALFLIMLRTGYIEAPHPGDSLQFWVKAVEENRPTAKRRMMTFLNYLDELDVPGNLIQPHYKQSLGAMCNEAGKIYFEGKLVKPNMAKACHLFAEASDLGNADGCANVAIQYVIFNRPEAEAGASSALAKLENASAGITDGQLLYLLGYSYDIGRGHAVDKAKARQFYEKSAAFGYQEAYQKLGLMELAGEGAPPDHASAAHWLQKAADGRDGPSCFYLAKLYHDGDGVPQDDQRANALLERACALGFQPACELLNASKK
ncbi:MAG TPA: tetratricopeptide repeat protein [Verrucomicrobiae bacterium]|nr:tetratricopeptide repeat protein [Verrucomicrobiae bacterium]